MWNLGITKAFHLIDERLHADVFVFPLLFPPFTILLVHRYI